MGSGKIGHSDSKIDKFVVYGQAHMGQMGKRP